MPIEERRRTERMRTRHLLAAGLAALLLGAAGPAGCGGGDAPAATAAGDVALRDFAFDPARAEIRAGDTVTWTNEGQQIHNVRGKGFFSDGMDAGATYRHRFTEPGTYRYLCTLHPTQMKGTIVVTVG